MATGKHKRGDTFDRSGTINVLQNGLPLLDLTGWTGMSQMRNARDALVVQFNFQWLNAAQSLVRLSAPDGTDSWPIGECKIDIQLTSPSGTVVSTDTMALEIVMDVTRA
jgi:hypothetical protein